MTNKKIVFQVPSGIRYVSDWEGFGFNMFSSRCIVNKQIPGCGYTEWALTCPANVIIASPRKMLLKNKKDQHPEVFLVVNEEDSDPNVDIDLNRNRDTKKVDDEGDTSRTRNKKKRLTKKEREERRKTFRYELFKKIKEYLKTIMSFENLVVNRNSKKYAKILVTYDSYYIVKGILDELGYFKYFHTVVDEMQSILSDARFKSDTELKFMKALENVDKVQFISATPILSKYLFMLDDFNSMPYYKLDWETLDPGRVKKPEFEGILTMKSVGTKLREIIGKYQRREFSSRYVVREGVRELVTSDEAVFYVNSVKHIITAIKKCNLLPSDVNILCADTPDNKKRIQEELGKSFNVGEIPLRGIKPKMFTFCTRTVYLGADFYSDCARSFIFSDANSDCLAVDISQDIPQIFGRQRLDTNPWRNCATLYYRSMADYKKMTEIDYKTQIDNKIRVTNNLLGALKEISPDKIKDLLKVYSGHAKNNHYKEDYVSVTNGEANFNTYAHVSDIRAFDIQQKDYADRFTVFSSATSLSGHVQGDREISNFLKKYQEISGKTWERLKMVCEFHFKHGDSISSRLIDNLQDVDPVKEIFLAAGPEICRSHGYIISSIRSNLSSGVITDFSKEKLDNRIYSEFEVGKQYKKSEIKDKLQSIFNELNYGKKAKAISINEWFVTSSASIRESGKRYDGLTLKESKKSK